MKKITSYIMGWIAHFAHFGLRLTCRYLWHKIRLFFKYGTFGLHKQGLIETKREYQRLQKALCKLIIGGNEVCKALKGVGIQLDKLAKYTVLLMEIEQ